MDTSSEAQQAEEDAQLTADSQRCSVVLAAGGGKTELIARAVLRNSQQGGRQLVLTHTHAGVAALRERLHRLRVPPASYHVHTLDGFALRFTRHYPLLAGTKIVEPDGEEWNEIRQGAERVLRSKHLRRVIRESYTGLYVDEYQDCGFRQHEIVLRLAEELRTRIVGDPLQGIFEFSGIVDWKTDVAPEFPRLSIHETPWRWLYSNPALGARLHEIRQCLVDGKAFTLDSGDELSWRPQSPENQVKVCHGAAKDSKEVVAIHRWAGQCHGLAKKLNGSFSSMEELAGKDLLRTANTLDAAEGIEGAVALLEFAKSCMTKLPTGLSATIDLFRNDERARTHATRNHRETYLALNNMADQPSPATLLTAMKAIERLPGPFIHRRECWYEMKRALRIFETEPEVANLKEAVLQVRDRTRRLGRVAEQRTISRTLLVKGLEYDHAIVLDADQLKDPRELYVALTRGRRAVTVLSKSRRIQRPPAIVWE